MAPADSEANPGPRRLFVRPPRLALAIILCAGLIDPLSHLLVANFPPAGAVFTGGHTVDTFNYLTGMRYARPPWYSPYSLCGDAGADGDPAIYAIPHHHLFGLVGAIGSRLHIPPFHMAGIANGLCAMFYLYAVYCFLAIAVPRLANRAFLLFGLGGGLGGLLYVLTWPFGVHDHPEFGRYFLRYFIYELNDGPRFQPWLMAARMYYTLAFGFGFFALAALARGILYGRRADLAIASALFAATAFANFRVGPMLWAAGFLHLGCAAGGASVAGIADAPPARPAASYWTFRQSGLWIAVSFIGVMIGGGAALWMVSRNPQLVESVARSQRTALWFSPFISATFFYWMILPTTLVRGIQQAPGWLRYAGWTAFAYIAAFALLYAGYQAYYGNFLITGEFQVAVLMSDYALLFGVPIGLAAAWWIGTPSQRFPFPPGGLPFTAREPHAPPHHACEGGYRARGDATPEVPPWAALWLLAFFGLSFSAWGQGSFLRFTPDRFVIVLGVPLAILGAAAIERGISRRPRFFRGMQLAILCCGILSILVTWLVSHGPLGYHTLQRHYSWTRNPYMNQADADALVHLGEGVVLAPATGAPLMGDLAVMRGNPTVYGIGTLDYSRRVVTGIRADVADFYRPETADAWRREKAAEWCVRYVFCPDTDPVDPGTVAQLRACEWLEEVAAVGDAVLFRVR
ncbi:MAG: hypothetical protein KF886_16440 [Candidatus Hydrogenedentes bacterium]|nr:hypothetical protein [Candidatus Hydrogenedentota bacterium]